MSLDTERGVAFERAFWYLRCNAIGGAVVELGVHYGESLAMLTRLAGDRRIVGLDSFAGMPEPGPHDSPQFKPSTFQCTTGDVARTFEAQHLSPARVELVKGCFADLEPLDIGPVALVHLDCDLYQSAVDGLRLIDPVDGAVVLIDDYYCHRARPDLGVRRAWSEWLAATGRTATEFDRYGWHGRAYVVHEGDP